MNCNTCLIILQFSWNQQTLLLEPFQSWLTHDTLITHLSMEIMQKPFPNYQLSLITLKDLCALVASHSHHPSLQPKFSWQIRVTLPLTKFSHDSRFTSSTPQTKFLHDIMIMSSRLWRLIFTLCYPLKLLFISNKFYLSTKLNGIIRF